MQSNTYSFSSYFHVGHPWLKDWEIAWLAGGWRDCRDGWSAGLKGGGEVGEVVCEVLLSLFFFWKDWEHGTEEGDKGTRLRTKSVSVCSPDRLFGCSSRSLEAWCSWVVISGCSLARLSACLLIRVSACSSLGISACSLMWVCLSAQCSLVAFLDCTSCCSVGVLGCTGVEVPIKHIYFHKNILQKRPYI